MSRPNLAQLLGAFDAAGVSFQRNGDGLLLTPADRVTPELAALTRDNKERLMVIAWLDGSAYGPLQPLPRPAWATRPVARRRWEA